MSEITGQLLLQLVLILLNAFFASTEIAVISLNEKKLKARAEDGDKKAVKMLRMIPVSYTHLACLIFFQDVMTIQTNRQTVKNRIPESDCPYARRSSKRTAEISAPKT